MDIALVTGAERGAGLRIAQKLIDLGLRVYGLSHDFSKCHFQHPDFVPVVCDLTSREALVRAWEQICERDPVVSCLVHTARHEPASPLEALRPEEIEYTLNTTLLCPMVLARLAAPSLMRTHGQVILVGPNTAGGPTASATLAAADAGLFAFGQSLFDELRDTGVKVCTVCPERNRGEPDPKGRLRLQPQSEIDNALVADAVETILSFKGHNAISQVVLRPQGQREEPIIATAVPELTRAKHAVILPPPEKRSDEAKLIPTPERQRPADAPPPEANAEEEEDEEDDVLDQLLEESRELLRKQRDMARNKLEKTEEKRRQAERPRFIPIEPEAQPEPPEVSEEARREAEAARARLASLLGIPADEPWAKERLTEAAERIVSKDETDDENAPEDLENGAPWWHNEDDDAPNEEESDVAPSHEDDENSHEQDEEDEYEEDEYDAEDDPSERENADDLGDESDAEEDLADWDIAAGLGEEASEDETEPDETPQSPTQAPPKRRPRGRRRS